MLYNKKREEAPYIDKSEGRRECGGFWAGQWAMRKLSTHGAPRFSFLLNVHDLTNSLT
jgi:hypothetical protein